MSKSKPIPSVSFPEGQFEKILEKHKDYLNRLSPQILWELPWDAETPDKELETIATQL
jgi:hypothetical protein